VPAGDEIFRLIEAPCYPVRDQDRWSLSDDSVLDVPVLVRVEDLRRVLRKPVTSSTEVTLIQHGSHQEDQQEETEYGEGRPAKNDAPPALPKNRRRRGTGGNRLGTVVRHAGTTTPEWTSRVDTLTLPRFARPGPKVPKG
jgi:hypothetical protein